MLLPSCVATAGALCFQASTQVRAPRSICDSDSDSYSDSESEREKKFKSIHGLFNALKFLDLSASKQKIMPQHKEGDYSVISEFLFHRNVDSV